MFNKSVTSDSNKIHKESFKERESNSLHDVALK